MARPTILIADDTESYRLATADRLKRAGYRVLTAASPSEARDLLANNKTIELVVLDLRLETGNKDDKSGLDIALDESLRSIPKIIVTAYRIGAKDIREALGIDPDGLPAAIDIISKNDGYEVLIRAIRRALALAERFRHSIDELTRQLEDDYQLARSQARRNFLAALVFSILAFFLILAGTAEAIWGTLESGIMTVVAGLLTQATTILFHRQASVASQRMDEYHRELLQLRWFDNLMAACTELPLREAHECRRSIIQTSARQVLVTRSVNEKWTPVVVGAMGNEGNE